MDGRRHGAKIKYFQPKKFANFDEIVKKKKERKDEIQNPSKDVRLNLFWRLASAALTLRLRPRTAALAAAMAVADIMA